MSIDMEKTPAALAMEWSIQLEKSFRAKKPDKSFEALKEIGSRLERWNSDWNQMGVAEYQMQGLIPGELKLFLNSIFLRLVDAFRFGDKKIKKEVVSMFIRVKRSRRLNSKEGILSKDILENVLELLRRVKEVYDREDAEERMLALMLFGSWADLAHDSPDARYIVLSSMVSIDVREVKASFFAAGCFSELSGDFGTIFLTMLTPMLASSTVSKDVKLAGGTALGKICFSSSLAKKAYEAGLNLLMDSLDDDLSAVMLTALSRIACVWKMLLPTQFKLLVMFLGEDRSLCLRTTSLKCCFYILAKGVCDYSSIAEVVQNLFGVLSIPELPLSMQLEAFKVLHKILPFYLSTIPSMKMSDSFLKILAAVQNMLQLSVVSNRVLGVRVVTDLSCNFLEQMVVVAGKISSDLIKQVIGFVLEQILFLLTPRVEIPDSSDLVIKRLWNLFLMLVENHSHICCTVLDQICLFIEKLVKMLDGEGMSSSHSKLVKSEFMCYVSKVIVVCMQNVEETNTGVCLIDAVKLQAEKVSHHCYFSSYTRMAYLFILHIHATCNYLRLMAEELVSVDGNSNLSYVDSVFHFDTLTFDCAKKMILCETSYWSCYKVGKIASCLGAWSTSAFVFEQLSKVIQSSTFICWLKSLAQFSASENQMKQLLFVNRSAGNLSVREAISLKNDQNTINTILRAHSMVLSSKECLSSSDIADQFCFQLWFLNLRAKILKTIADVLNLLNTVLYSRDVPGLSGREEYFPHPCTASDKLESLIYTSYEISKKMQMFALEFDLLQLSFVGMNAQSVMILTTVAWCCSLMAFTSGFAFLTSSLCSENFKNLKKPFHALLIEDLAARLMHIDGNTRESLLFLSKSCKSCEQHFLNRARHRISCTYGINVLQKLSKDSIRRIASFQKQATPVQGDVKESIQVQHNADAVVQIIKDGSELVLNVISCWFATIFRTPYHFFRVRPAMSSKLSAMNDAGKFSNDITVSLGCHLSLNLCFQLKNIPPDLSGPVSKVYCILYCGLPSRIKLGAGEYNGQARLNGQDWDIEDIVKLNQKLLNYVTGTSKSRSGEVEEWPVVNEYLCFKLSKRGQGFSSCVLDLSSFPVGYYRIKWHCGFVDSRGSYCSLLPTKSGPFFTIQIVTDANIR